MNLQHVTNSTHSTNRRSYCGTRMPFLPASGRNCVHLSLQSIYPCQRAEYYSWQWKVSDSLGSQRNSGKGNISPELLKFGQLAVSLLWRSSQTLWRHFQVSQGEVLTLLQPVTNPISPDFISMFQEFISTWRSIKRCSGWGQGKEEKPHWFYISDKQLYLLK